jgi:hypothetical protein
MVSAMLGSDASATMNAKTSAPPVPPVVRPTAPPATLDTITKTLSKVV